MRVFLVFVSAILLAQAPPPAPKPATQGKPAAKSTGAAAKPAKPRPAAARKPAAAPAKSPALATDDEKTIYALGLSLAQTLAPFNLSRGEIEIVKRGLTDAVAGKPAVELSDWGPKIRLLAAERQKVASKVYLDKAAAEPGAVKSESGLIYREVTAGTGASPKASDKVKVNYRGTLVNGTEFDSSYRRNEPAEFPLNGVIPCWTEGVQKMKAGGKAILVCPAELAYGDRGRPSIPGGAALIFEIELLEVSPAPEAPATPAPPAPAK